jgi:2-polyprenyl-3-methyl-5-hydroxy-6-metoxy-1,4-benzoquinol methylase
MVGADAASDWMLKHACRITEGMRVVDIGCGPGDIVNVVPPIEYVGVDISEAYIAQAAATHGSRGVFRAGTARVLLDEPRAFNADLVMCMGVLHHLDDHEVREVLDVAMQLLKPGGRFVAIEPSYLVKQSRLSKWIMSKDRGQSIRTDARWREMTDGTPFQTVHVRVLTALLRIPYIHVVIEGTKH